MGWANYGVIPVSLCVLYRIYIIIGFFNIERIFNVEPRLYNTSFPTQLFSTVLSVKVCSFWVSRERNSAALLVKVKGVERIVSPMKNGDLRGY